MYIMKLEFVLFIVMLQNVYTIEYFDINFCFSSLQTQTSVALLLPNSKYLSLPFRLFDATPIPSQCINLLKDFAQAASNFTMCSIINAQPVRLCEKCIEHHMSFQNKYNELITTQVANTSCKSLFISKDRLDVVLEYHNSILMIWNKGKCSECFTWGETGPVLSNSTKKFTAMYTSTMDCIIKNKFDTEHVCEKCMQLYIALDEHYKSLSSDSIGVDVVCMDIVDSMNTTRFIWSKTLNCCKLRWTPEVIFLCCTGVISFLPIFFYLSVRFCGPIRDLPNVLNQSRLKQKFMTWTENRRIS